MPKDTMFDELVIFLKEEEAVKIIEGPAGGIDDGGVMFCWTTCVCFCLSNFAPGSSMPSTARFSR